MKTAAQRLLDKVRDMLMEGSPKRLLRGDAVDAFVELASIDAAPHTRQLADEMRALARDLMRDRDPRASDPGVGPRVIACFASECADKGASPPFHVNSVPLHALWDSCVNQLVAARLGACSPVKVDPKPPVLVTPLAAAKPRSFRASRG
jgi:hypothetical protein